MLEGVKGYRTNITNLPLELIVSRYNDLWHIERVFRIAKSDLEARPVYHRRKEAIQYHILIVFSALCLSRVIEKETGYSVAKVMEDLPGKWLLTLTDKITSNTLDIEFDSKSH